MRVRKVKSGLTVNAVAGVYVVFFGFDLADGKRKGFKGFAVKRRDHDDGETTWVRGMKTFQSVEPHPAKGENFSSLQHPVQSFQWCDYSVKPGVTYTYTVVSLYGDPSNLQVGTEVDLEITAEVATGPVHSAFFNRGSVATQEYARRFENRRPSEAGPGAYEWLSRGLLEALVAFLGRAGKGWSIHGAVYEFQWPEALQAVKDARKRGAKVKILFDDIPGKSGPSRKNNKAIADMKLGSVCQGRANGKLMHNKFFVLSKADKPVAVWTASTNLTENGIFGHANVGHIVDDEDVARAFRDYWDRLNDDPPIAADYRHANMAASPAPPQPWKGATTAVFSPRDSALDALEWYAQLAASAKDALFMTFAFGMHEKFQAVYLQEDDVLRMALMESPGMTKDAPQQIQAIRNRPNVVVAIGNRIATNELDQWLHELDAVNKQVHVHWVHTKYMLIDPLGKHPIVVTGSANFSKASTYTNDENMLVIRGDKRIADIYFGEMIRLFAHYSFREAVKWWAEKKAKGKVEDWQPSFLVEDDMWMTDYFSSKDRSGRRARREYFSRPMG